MLIDILIGKCRRQFFVNLLRNAVLHSTINVCPQKISLPPHTFSESLNRFDEYGTLSRERLLLFNIFNIYVVPRGASCASYLNTELYQKSKLITKKRHVWCVSQVPCVLVTNRWLLTTILGEVKTRARKTKRRGMRNLSISAYANVSVFFRWKTREGFLYF